MSILKTTAVVMTLVQQAARAAATADNAALHGYLADAIVHLSLLKVKCADEVFAAPAFDVDDEVMPTAVVPALI